MTKTNHDIHGNAYRQTVFEVSATGATGTSAATDTYRDAADRPIAREQTGGPRVETQYDALNRAVRTQTLAATTVVAQTETVYDLRDSAVEQHTYELNAGESTGITPTSTNYTRRSVFAWHDLAGRLTTQADYGSGGPMWSYYPKPTRPTTAPTESSENALVTKITYNPTTGEADTTIDPAGSIAKNVTDALSRPIKTYQNYKTGTSTAPDEDVEIRYAYDGVNNIVALTAVNPTTGNQVTRYLYEDPVNAILETSAIYPDSSDTSSGGTDQVKTQYYLDGNIKTVADQNGTTRNFTYDNHRRPVADTVTTLDQNVDGAVRKITQTHDWSGAVTAIASRDVNGTVLNEIALEYDGNRKLSRLFQSYGGSVDADTTPYLAYQRDGIEKSFRLTGATYPGGKALSYEYGPTDSREDILNIYTTIKDGNQTVVNYLDMGIGTTAQVTYPEPNLALATSGPALDRFGRTVNHAWMKDNVALTHIIHAYDFAGNRTSRHDAVHATNSELYEYDAINQIKSLNRGVLSQTQDAITTSVFEESWQFDKTGNWLEFNKNGATETRTHNKANELQGIATHDANGNMTLMPGLKAKYDAWNRLTEVRDLSDNVIATYEYNGMNQRIKKAVGTTVTTSFFNENWQELESTTGNELTTYVWGLRYIDDLIYREKGPERLYALQDPNWNVIAITDATGDVVEHYKYDAFGKTTVLDENFAEKPISTHLWNRTFTGQVYDHETGLMLYRNRFYHTGLGRFVNRDPLAFRGGDANLYRYTGNRSPVYLDPFGKQKASWGPPWNAKPPQYESPIGPSSGFPASPPPSPTYSQMISGGGHAGAQPLVFADGSVKPVSLNVGPVPIAPPNTEPGASNTPIDPNTLPKPPQEHVDNLYCCLEFEYNWERLGYSGLADCMRGEFSKTPVVGDPFFAVPAGALSLCKKFTTAIGPPLVIAETTNLGISYLTCSERTCKKATGVSYKFKGNRLVPHCPKGTLVDAILTPINK